MSSTSSLPEDLLDFINSSSSLSVKVIPNSRRTEIVSLVDGILKIALKAPAENNKANLELVKFISKISGKRVAIISGLTSRNKILRLE